MQEGRYVGEKNVAAINITYFNAKNVADRIVFEDGQIVTNAVGTSNVDLNNRARFRTIVSHPMLFRAGLSSARNAWNEGVALK